MSETPQRPSNARTAMMAVGIVVGMAALSFASVPLYRLFCQVTGFGGTPMAGGEAPAEHGSRTVTVRFDANVAGGPHPLDWRFAGSPSPVKVVTGEDKLIFYKATNRGEAETTGTASFNVTPLKRRHPISTRSRVSASPTRRWRRAKAWTCRCPSMSIPRSRRTPIFAT